MKTIDIKLKYFNYNPIRWIKKFFEKDRHSVFFEIDLDTFYDEEYDENGDVFMWSKPKAIINTSNYKNLKFQIKNGFNRDVKLSYGNKIYQKKLLNNTTYNFEIDCFYVKQVSIEVEPFFGEDDDRELGLNFSKIN